MFGIMEYGNNFWGVWNLNLVQKLSLLGAAAKYDVCAASGCSSGGLSGMPSPRSGVCHSFLPDGRCISLFKVLQTNSCQKDCFYCPNRVQRDIPRASFTPEELAGLFLEFYRRNYVEGLFLSSGICKSPGDTMEQIIKTAEILRYRYRFNGYIHLKIIPGAKPEYIEQAVRLASRVSVNIEAPTAAHLQKLSKLKDFNDGIINRMKWINRLQNGGLLPAGQTTQFMVGAAGESDAAILKTTSGLYHGIGLKRVYFSAFQPVAGTPLEGMSPATVLREHRLYQCDFLFRLYGFKLTDISFNQDGNLPEDLDPKLNYALNNLQLFPLEVNKASYSELLRVPGIGPASARRIVSARKQFKFNTLDELKNTGAVVKRASPFVQINGRYRESYKLVQQLELWRDSVDYSSQRQPRVISQGSHALTPV